MIIFNAKTNTELKAHLHKNSTAQIILKCQINPVLCGRNMENHKSSDQQNANFPKQTLKTHPEDIQASTTPQNTTKHNWNANQTQEMGLDWAHLDKTSLQHHKTGLVLESTGGKKDYQEGPGTPGQGLLRHNSRNEEHIGRKQNEEPAEETSWKLPEAHKGFKLSKTLYVMFTTTELFLFITATGSDAAKSRVLSSLTSLLIELEGCKRYGRRSLGEAEHEHVHCHLIRERNNESGLIISKWNAAQAAWTT